MELQLPFSIGTRDISSLFTLSQSIRSCTDEKIILDGSKVEFIDPLGLTVLASALDSQSGKLISMPWLDTKISSYMARMNFFDNCDVENIEIPTHARNDVREKLVELTVMKDVTDADTDILANRLADAMTGVLTDVLGPPERYRTTEYEKYRHPIWYSLSELLANSVTHAKRNGHLQSKVWTAAQYYEKTGIVRIAIVDNGCGFLSTLRNHEKLPEKTHLAAIKTALIPRVSCNREGPFFDERGNQGVGLTTTAKIAKSARGGLTIISGDGIYQTVMDQSRTLGAGAQWDGVAIALHCRRHLLPSVRVSALLPPEPQPVNVNFTE